MKKIILKNTLFFYGMLLFIVACVQQDPIDVPESEKLQQVESYTSNWQDWDSSTLFGGGIHDFSLDPRQRVKAFEFERTVFDNLLENADVEYISFYFGVDENNEMVLVVYGLDKEYHKFLADDMFDIGMKTDIEFPHTQAFDFDDALYLASQESSMPAEAFQHLIGMQLGSKMCSDWENMTSEKDLLHAVTIDGQRLQALTFHKAIFEQVFIPESLHKLIVFLGIGQEDGLLHPIAAGKNGAGDLILPKGVDGRKDNGDDGRLAEKGVPCPPFCPPEK